MKFRLDLQHYINDRLLEPGHVIGDETDMPMVLPNGEPMKPSVNMTPLDDEARKLFSDTFPGSRLPDRDPTKAIPLRGTGDSAKQPALYQKGPDGKVLQPGDLVHGEPKKGLPDPESPNRPVGQPVVGHLPNTPTPTVQPKPEDPALRVNAPQAEKDAVAAAQKKAQDDASKEKK